VTLRAALEIQLQKPFFFACFFLCGKKKATGGKL